MERVFVPQRSARGAQWSSTAGEDPFSLRNWCFWCRESALISAHFLRCGCFFLTQETKLQKKSLISLRDKLSQDLLKNRSKLIFIFIFYELLFPKSYYIEIRKNTLIKNRSNFKTYTILPKVLCHLPWLIYRAGPAYKRTKRLLWAPWPLGGPMMGAP